MGDEMRHPARAVSQILKTVASHVRAGVSTAVLDLIAEDAIKTAGVFSYNKGYHPEWSKEPYPFATCISVNNVIAHGLPSEKKILKDGDLVNIDLGIIDKDGNCGDAAFSLAVGSPSEDDRMLLRYAKKATYAGIEVLKDGVYLFEIALAMQRKVDERKFVINRQMCSHAIGKKMHDDPIIYNVPNHYQHHDQEKYLRYQKIMDQQLKEGMVVCIEPIVTLFDKWGMIDSTTGWAVKTQDGKKAAMFEHMVLITKTGYEILTDHFEKDEI